MSHFPALHSILLVALISCAIFPAILSNPTESLVRRKSSLRETECFSYNKIGFHVGPAGHEEGLVDYFHALDSAGIPISLKSADEYGIVDVVVQMKKKSGVKHVLVWRNTRLDVPNYNIAPEEAAQDIWAKNMEMLPPEFDKDNVWLEIINEPDQNRADWLGWFGLAIAKLGVQNGYRVAVFGFSSGTPEVIEPNNAWETGGMMALLKYTQQYPESVAISLHEYSFSDDIMNQYPWLVGRFKFLFETCDKHNISRPTIFISEWGWEAFSVPDVDHSIEDIRKIAAIYAQYDQIRGAGLWYLGGGFGNIAEKAVRLIAPVANMTLHEKFPKNCTSPMGW